MASKVKIYTRTGDNCQTSIYGGKRVSKADPRVSAYGSIDELNSFIGMLGVKADDKKVRDFLKKIQADLFTIGAVLSGDSISISNLSNRVVEIEKFIDRLDAHLPELKNFILPGGSEAGAWAHIVRSIVRRAERETVKIAKEVNVDTRILTYLNRLSDLFFVIARYLNNKEKTGETVWKKDN